METTKNSSIIPSKTLLFIAFIQGLALLFLHQSIEFEFWPNNDPEWLFALYTVAITAPNMLLLSLSKNNSRMVYQWTMIYSLIGLFSLGYYLGSQLIDKHKPGFFFIVTLGIASFKCLMYIQHFAERGPLVYSRLFLFSWRNFLTLGLSLLFTLCTWGVLMLWAGLFKVIKINFFYDLFTTRWFYYPILALTNGFGIIIFRHQAKVIDTITRLQQALMKFLLIILSLVSVIFLLTLLFTGLSPLWEAGGSTLILCMQALMLFFINSVYQDDPKSQPYHLWVHRFIYIGVALLPIYSAISFYGLSLRVEQHGWSVSRCFAFLLWSIFAAFSVGYLWGIIRLKDQWLHQLSWVNVRMGLAVFGLMLLINSPVLDFRKITVSSQLNRLDKGLVSLKNFDYNHFKNQLEKPGQEALQELKRTIQAKHPEVSLRINGLYTTDSNDLPASTKEDFLRATSGINKDTPKELIDTIYQTLSKNIWKININQSYQLLTVELNGDDKLEYIFVETRHNDIAFTMYHYSDGHWEGIALRSLHGEHDTHGTKKNDLLEALKSGEYGTTENDWRYLRIGDFHFQVP